MPFCSTRRPTVMTVGAAKVAVSLVGGAAKGLGRKASFCLGTKDLKRGRARPCCSRSPRRPRDRRCAAAARLWHDASAGVDRCVRR